MVPLRPAGPAAEPLQAGSASLRPPDAPNARRKRALFSLKCRRAMAAFAGAAADRDALRR